MRTVRPLVLALVVLAGALRLADANPAVAQTQVVPVWQTAVAPGTDGFDPAWQSVVPTLVALTGQQANPPMGGGSIRSVAVRGLHHDGRLYLMLEWADPTADLRSDRVERFTDAAAVQFPSTSGTAVPAICMGQADQAMNIWQWRADAQTGLPDRPHAVYVDGYPSTDPLFYPARAAGNALSTGHAVQNLVAGGFGTLEPAAEQAVTGAGNHRMNRWTVVFVRDLASPGALQPALDDTAIDTAFAVWDGSQSERNGMKSVSAFVRLQVTPEPPPWRDNPGGFLDTTILAVLAGVLLAGAAVWVYLARRPERP